MARLSQSIPRIPGIDVACAAGRVSEIGRERKPNKAREATPKAVWFVVSSYRFFVHHEPDVERFLVF